MFRYAMAGVASIMVAASLLAGGVASADQGDWLARARIINIKPNASSSALALDVDTRTTLELDFSYFVTSNVALELILATQRHNVTSGVVGPVGHVSHLPPTLTLQYHFRPGATFRPYVGAGLNYTRFYDISLLGGALTVDKNSFGGALQVGADIQLNKTFFLNLDVKHIWIETDVKSVATGATLTNLKINPWVIGLGIGMKF